MFLHFCILKEEQTKKNSKSKSKFKWNFDCLCLLCWRNEKKNNINCYNAYWVIDWWSSMLKAKHWFNWSLGKQWEFFDVFIVMLFDVLSIYLKLKINKIPLFVQSFLFFNVLTYFLWVFWVGKLLPALTTAYSLPSILISFFYISFLIFFLLMD